MKLQFTNNVVVHSAGQLSCAYPVVDACELAEVIVVLYDYMAFPRELPARNLFAYRPNGTLLWRAADIGHGPVDAYTNIISEKPLVVGNFAGYECTVDVRTGQVRSTRFTK